MNSHKYSALKQVMKTGRLLTSQSQLIAYESDALGYKKFIPDAVAIPANADELIALIKALKDIKVPWTVRGAGTSLSGGPVAAQGGVIIHLSQLNRIEEINVSEGYVLLQCGVTLNQLNQALKPWGFHYPPDPSSGSVSSLGGNVACNAGGVHCFRYGVTGNYVLGVEAILPDGSLVQFGGPAGGKGNRQDDWKRLFVGSEGTLGVFTRFWLRIIPSPEKVWTFLATYPDVKSAGLAVQQLARHPAYPSAIEFMDPRCVNMVESSPMAVGLPLGAFVILTEIDGPPALVDGRVKSILLLLRKCGSSDVKYSDQAEARMNLWKARKAVGGLLGQISPDFIVQDAVIPKKYLADALEFLYREADRKGVKVATVIHAGDGNLHPNFLFDAKKPGELEIIESIGKRLMRWVTGKGGTLSGEHGIGNDKSAYTAEFFGSTGKLVQMSIPEVFNPTHQLNPLKVFPERVFVCH